MRLAKGFCTICGRERHPFKIATQHNPSNTILVPHCMDNSDCTAQAKAAVAGADIRLKTADQDDLADHEQEDGFDDVP